MANAQTKRKRRTTPLPISPTWLSRVQAFRRSFNLQDKDWQETVQLKADISAHLKQNPAAGLTRALFDRVVKWKLDKQINRPRKFSKTVTDDLVMKITACAFSLQHTDPSVLARVRLDTLSALPGVDIGVASAILALSLPDEYGVIDPRIWKEMYGQDKTGFSLPDYTMYLAHLLEGARQLGWIAEELDFFTWRSSQN
jgi:hypothetical protein